MKVQSKKDEYIVLCENSKEVTIVKNTLCNRNEKSWFDYKYVVNSKEHFPNEMLWNQIPYEENKLPIISFEEWEKLPDEEFVLPEKWAVKVTKENESILTDWKIKKNKELTDKASVWDYVGYEGSGVPQSYMDYDSYTEITFEQFKEHVLKEIPKLEYEPKDVAFKPVGYNFKDEKIRNIVKAFLGDINIYKSDSYDFPAKGYVYQELKELQVLDLWCDKVLFEKESEFNSSNAFKELTKETDKMLKIIGYKLIKPEYKEAFAKLMDIDVDYVYSTESEPFHFSVNCVIEDKMIKLNLINVWCEKIYETSITLKSSVKLSEDDIAEVKEILNNK